MRRKWSAGVVMLGVLWGAWATLSWLISYPDMTRSEGLNTYWWCYLLALACFIVGVPGMSEDPQ